VGISDNLRAFIDPEYSSFKGMPKSDVDAALKWATAIGPEIEIFLAPGAPSGLISAGSSAAFIGVMGLPVHFKTSNVINNVALGLDAAMLAAAAAIMGASSVFLPIAPTSPFDSENKIFGTKFTPLEICQRCEERVIEWLKTGTYAAFYIPPGKPPAGFPGKPGTAWGAVPVLTDEDKATMDSDEDGVPIPDDSDDEDPDVQ
jgi:hypothetical protein